MRTSTCRVCPASIVWAVTVNGKAIPVDAEPDPDGNVRLTEGTISLEAVVLGPLERMLEDGPLHMPHHATCPNWSGSR